MSSFTAEIKKDLPAIITCIVYNCLCPYLSLSVKENLGITCTVWSLNNFISSRALAVRRRRISRHFTVDHEVFHQIVKFILNHTCLTGQNKRRQRRDSGSSPPAQNLIVGGKRARKTVARPDLGQDWSDDDEPDPYGTDEEDEWQPDSAPSQDYSEDYL